MGNVSLLHGWQQHRNDVVTISMTIVSHCIHPHHFFPYNDCPFRRLCYDHKSEVKYDESHIREM